MKTCVYCGNIIQKDSDEHIIHNALGGLYVSKEICCEKCNNILSHKIDAPFTKNFNSIINLIPNLAKTNKSAKPVCPGYARFLGDDKIYEVNLKKGKVISCPEISKKIKRPIKQEDFKDIIYKFDVNSPSFYNGIKKIAFNFAIDKNIPYDKMKNNIKIEKEGSIVKDISFNFKSVPFYPLSPIDEFLELNYHIELFHFLLLFNIKNRLWCYVDLFNTFQFYILLSEDWDQELNIHETYFQQVQTISRDILPIECYSPKDLNMLAQEYNVSFTNKKYKQIYNEIKEAKRKKELKSDAALFFSSRLSCPNLILLFQDMLKEKDMYEVALKYMKNFYTEDDKVNETFFKKYTLSNDGNLYSYPEKIAELLYNGKIEIKHYTYPKFFKLSSYLNEIGKKSTDH